MLQMLSKKLVNADIWIYFNGTWHWIEDSPESPSQGPEEM